MFFVKCLLLLFVLNEIDCGLSNTINCVTPRIAHGRVRIQRRTKLVKFTCFSGYDLVGYKYATCKNGKWDEELPVCIRAGCKPIPKPDNGLQWALHDGAWIVTFCYPGYSLKGSSPVYCNGYTWNATAPVCVETKAPSKLSCDFEEPDICGWTQDDLHDFDWKRQNKHTPSYFLKTGPSYDHTLGVGRDGYYMYIESTSIMENNTARLLSPVFDGGLAKDGCFSFFYHMYGKTTGGLKIYQKPDNIALEALLQLPAVDQKRYLLFEKWGDQGDVWYRGVSNLNDFKDNFQIVIEGIRGSSFTSDIAVDDVAVLHGENCTVAKRVAVTPSEPESESCAGRCDVYGAGGFKPLPSGGGCHCSVDCFVIDNCCPDFFDLCVFEETTPDTMPQTQKLVASTTSTAATTVTSISTTVGTSTTQKLSPAKVPPPVIPKVSPPVLPNFPSPVLPNITKAETTSSKPSPVSTTTRATTTTKQSTTVRLPTTETAKTTLSSRRTPKLVFKSTVAIYNATERIRKDNSTRKPEFSKTTKASTTRPSTRAATDTKKRAIVTTQRPSERTRVKTVRTDTLPVEENVESRGLRTGIIVITSLAMLAGLAWFAFWARGSKGRASISRLRGRATSHPEVRFLTANADEEAE